MDGKKVLVAVPIKTRTQLLSVNSFQIHWTVPMPEGARPCPYRGCLMACDWLQLSNKIFPVVTDINVGAVITNHGRRIIIKRQAAALIRAFVNVENRGENRGTCNAARACTLACDSRAPGKMSATVAPAVPPALKTPLSVEAVPPFVPVLAPDFELRKL